MAVDFRFSIRGIEQALADVDREIERQTRRELSRRLSLLINALRDATPVDTGRARRGWRLNIVRPTLRGELETTITNDVPYIVDLNMGTSRQAPARFIELASLRYFTPDGVIVQVRSRV